MANTSIDLVGLDFNSLKSNLTTFLKNNTQFKDVNYEGSNINVLLDILAYNTYLNAFYTNMVASEMFLDSAQLRDSVVSHAKELDYSPRSFTSSRAQILLDITPANSVPSIVMPRFTSFTSRVGSNTYSFSTNETFVITANNITGKYLLTTDIYEGIVVTDTFVVNYANTTQRFVLSNPTVDTNSLNVTVYEDNGINNLTYVKAIDLNLVKSTSKSFFIQAAENQQYEIFFGDNIFGRRPKDGSIVSVKYRASSGELPNGASVFVIDGPVDGHSNISISTVSSATGGAVVESIESIKYNAPRAFQTQNRAVTVNDYKVLLQSNYPEISSINVYGGENLTPPQSGKVFIAVDTTNGDGASQYNKDTYLSFLKSRCPLTITPVFVDPNFLNARIVTDVQYNSGITTKTLADIKTLVQSAISNYNTNNLDGFDVTLYHSLLVKAINEADPSIISNSTKVYALLRYAPSLTQTNTFEINFGNRLLLDDTSRVSVSEAHYGFTLSTTSFVSEGVQCVIVDDSLGNVFLAAVGTPYITVLRKIGTINYLTGIINIADLNVSSFFGTGIEFLVKTIDQNIKSIENSLLSILPGDVVVNVTGIKV